MRPARPDDFRLPELRFVPVDSLIPHERHDKQRMEPLVEKLREQAILKNPPVVTPLSSDGGRERYMVLDGANRSTAAQAAGFPHVVVQVARYEDPWVHLSTWHHALSKVDPVRFDAACAAVEGMEARPEPLLNAQAELSRRESLAYAVHEGGRVVAFRGGSDLAERNELLNSLVDVYRSQHRFYRMSTESFNVAKERHPDVTTLVVFPHFSPAEVLELAEQGSKLPAGITRHLIRWRALRINVPIERLEDTDTPVEAKNAWLDAWLRDKFNHRLVRFYEESTVLFDE